MFVVDAQPVNDSPGEAVGAVLGGLDQLLGADVSAMAGDELGPLLLALESVQAKLDAVRGRAVGSFDARSLHAESGAKSTAAWLRVAGRVEAKRASRCVHHARALRDLPVAAEALAGGEISSDHVAKLDQVDNDRTRDALRRDEAILVSWARTMRYDRFCQRVAEWVEANDPDGGHRDRPEARRWHMSRTLGGSWAVDAWFDPISGEEFSAEHERIEAELFRADWAAARDRLGREPFVGELGRTPAQRRLDAVVEMARRAAAWRSSGGRRPRPLITIVTGSDAFRPMCREPTAPPGANPPTTTTDRHAGTGGTARGRQANAPARRVADQDSPKRARQPELVLARVPRATAARLRSHGSPALDPAPPSPSSGRLASAGGGWPEHRRRTVVRAPHG